MIFQYHHKKQYLESIRGCSNIEQRRVGWLCGGRKNKPVPAFGGGQLFGQVAVEAPCWYAPTTPRQPASTEQQKSQLHPLHPSNLSAALTPTLQG